MTTLRKFWPAFNGGSEQYAEVRLTDDAGLPLDLTDSEITATIIWDSDPNCGCRDWWWDGECWPGPSIDLVLADGIEILNLLPDDPAPGQEADPQFIIRLNETRTGQLPKGRGAAALFVKIVPSDGVTMIEGPVFMERR